MGKKLGGYQGAFRVLQITEYTSWMSAFWFFILSLFFAATPVPQEVSALPEVPSIQVSPAIVMQGEPALVTITGLASTSSVKTITFDENSEGVFLYHGQPAALIGIDLRREPGTYQISATLSDGRIFEKEISIAQRVVVEAPLGIPAKLGGNTVASQNALVSTLADENKSLAEIPTETSTLWTTEFTWPLTEVVVTDPYGYSRKTGAYTIPHKGTDFKASEGTPVLAMNRGIVRIATEYRTYGKTVVIDHGLGLMTLYMHLSKLNVKNGDVVEQGAIIGLSGKTGYAEYPHLHLSVRIGGTSIDPLKFFELFR